VWGPWNPCGPGELETYRSCHISAQDELHLDLDDDRDVKCNGKAFEAKPCAGAKAVIKQRSGIQAVVKQQPDHGAWGLWSEWSECSPPCVDCKNMKKRTRACPTQGTLKCKDETNPHDKGGYEESNDCPGKMTMANDLGKSGDIKIGHKYKDDFCGREDKYWTTLSSESGILYSHGSYGDQSASTPASPWSHLYENQQRTCNYLKVDECQKITFSFGNSSVFEIESEAHPFHHCPYDWLQIVDSNGDTLVDRTCGDTAPADFSSSTNKIVVIFKTDHNVRKQGFKLDWKANGGCNWSEWTAGNCNDGTGMRMFNRTCNKELFEGCDCSCPGDDVKYEECPVDCGYGDWTEWSECDSFGNQTRVRYGNNPTARNGGDDNCPDDEEMRNVSVDGGWTEWTAWGMCAEEGEARCTHTRERFCAKPCPYCGGNGCPGEPDESQPCEQDGGWTDWADWSGCTGQGGTERRTRSCTNPSPCGGGECIGPEEEIRECPVDCNWSEWSPSGECDPLTGYEIYSRTPDNPAPQDGGAQCEGSCFKQVNCTVDCGWNDWFQFSPCDDSKPYSHNVALWVRYPNNPLPLNGGAPCEGEGYEVRNCTIVQCDGAWSDWTEWSCCSDDSQSRQRYCNNPPPSDGGAACPGFPKETRSCECKPRVKVVIQNGRAEPLEDVRIDLSYEEQDHVYHTDAEGSTGFVTVTADSYPLEIIGLASKEGCTTVRFEEVIVACDNEITVTLTMVPFDEDIKINLNWKQADTDLDLVTDQFLSGEDICSTWFEQKNSCPGLYLDFDSMGGSLGIDNGTESTVIASPGRKIYGIYVNLYSKFTPEVSLPLSGASVSVYFGTRAHTLTQNFEVPQQTDDKKYKNWLIGCLVTWPENDSFTYDWFDLDRLVTDRSVDMAQICFGVMP